MARTHDLSGDLIQARAVMGTMIEDLSLIWSWVRKGEKEGRGEDLVCRREKEREGGKEISGEGEGEGEGRRTSSPSRSHDLRGELSEVSCRSRLSVGIEELRGVRGRGRRTRVVGGVEDLGGSLGVRANSHGVEEQGGI